MIADDEPLIRKMVGCILSGNDYSIIEAEDGFEAIHAFKNNILDIVILDINLPHVDGIKICKEIKNSPLGESTYVIMLTSLDDNNSIENAFKAGADDYILKPFNGLLLKEKIAHFLVGIIKMNYDELPASITFPL